MDELANIIEKYDKSYVNENLRTLDDINSFALIFFGDVAEIYDCLTRVKNTERNPSGYSLDDAPIMGY